MKCIAKILYTLIMTALIVVILAAALIPRVLGLVPLTLVSGSMEGKYSTGDLLVVKPLEDTEKETLHVGDVVSFYPTPNDISNLTSHRIIDVTTTGDDILYTTKGDATDSADKPIKPVQVAGKVLYHVPFAGYAVQATDDLDRTLVSQVIGVGLIAFAAFSTCSAFFRRKKGAAEADTDVPDAEVNAVSPSEKLLQAGLSPSQDQGLPLICSRDDNVRLGWNGPFSTHEYGYAGTCWRSQGGRTP